MKLLVLSGSSLLVLESTRSSSRLEVPAFVVGLCGL
jgi:hypothetical protein